MFVFSESSCHWRHGTADLSKPVSPSNQPTFQVTALFQGCQCNAGRCSSFQGYPWSSKLFHCSSVICTVYSYAQAIAATSVHHLCGWDYILLPPIWLLTGVVDIPYNLCIRGVARSGTRASLVNVSVEPPPPPSLFPNCILMIHQTLGSNL